MADDWFIIPIVTDSGAAEDGGDVQRPKYLDDGVPVDSFAGTILTYNSQQRYLSHVFADSTALSDLEGKGDVTKLSLSDVKTELDEHFIQTRVADEWDEWGRG